MAFLFGGYRTLGLFGAAVVTFVVGILLIVRGRMVGKFSISWSGLLLSISSLFILCFILLVRWQFGIGPIYSASRYPFDFEEMVSTLNVDMADAKISCIENFFDEEYVWRLTISPEQCEQAVEVNGLNEVTVDNVSGEFWQAFPFLWRPTHNDGCRYFSTPNFPMQRRGPDGVHYLAVYDPEEERIYVWYKFNW